MSRRESTVSAADVIIVAALVLAALAVVGTTCAAAAGAVGPEAITVAIAITLAITTVMLGMAASGTGPCRGWSQVSGGGASESIETARPAAEALRGAMEKHTQEEQSEGVLGSRVKDARKAKGLTARAIGEACGVSASAVSGWERGVAQPTTIALGRLARATGKSTDYFFGRAAA